ncbi:MAG: tRNA pseudouridine(38-40) synthase TruA [Proteobacteria bacterium]|nr:MAG: tRNA pseudouridine(38-40) synthase TruA [Pseudomonadota bacterium]
MTSATSTNICLIIEYKGAAFHGWQKQAPEQGLRTVQSALEDVLRTVLRCEIGELTTAGRTDAGVHARAQVVNFKVERSLEELPEMRVLSHAVSNILRGELSVLRAMPVSADFNARRDAISKQYSYLMLLRPSPAVLDRGYAWHISAELDLELMRREASQLLGKQDFRSFQGAYCQAKSTEREILESELIYDPPYLTYRVVGTGFLKQMVRNIVGTLAGLGKGRLKYATIGEILQQRDRKAAGVTAPAFGLYMDWVRYQGFSSAEACFTKI